VAQPWRDRGATVAHIRKAREREKMDLASPVFRGGVPVTPPDTGVRPSHAAKRGALVHTSTVDDSPSKRARLEPTPATPAATHHDEEEDERGNEDERGAQAPEVLVPAWTHPASDDAAQPMPAAEAEEAAAVAPIAVATPPRGRPRRARAVVLAPLPTPTPAVGASVEPVRRAVRPQGPASAFTVGRHGLQLVEAALELTWHPAAIQGGTSSHHNDSKRKGRERERERERAKACTCIPMQRSFIVLARRWHVCGCVCLAGG
jgi:hypothetical protein